MQDDLMPFDLPVEKSSIIKIVGVGGGGSNAVTHMFKQGIEGVNFVIANTDSQALANSPVPIKIQIGTSLTQGLGAGNKPERGREAAVENLEDIISSLGSTTRMVFITAGMGGGTGTGAAPVIAEATKKEGILTVGIVTIPFRFEGNRRIKQANEGIRELSKHVDSLLIIQNEKLKEIYSDLAISNAFERADDVLTVAAKGIAEIITVHGHVNVDFADVETVMSNSGIAVMGTGYGSGERRALDAIEEALNSPLLNNNDIYGAQNILVNIVSGEREASMEEMGQINEFIQDASGQSADLIWGNTVEPSLGERIAVTIIATGFKTNVLPDIFPEKEDDKEVNHLKETKRNKNVVEWGDFDNSGDDNDAFKNVFEEDKKQNKVENNDDVFEVKENDSVKKEDETEVFTLDDIFAESEKDFNSKTHKQEDNTPKKEDTQRNNNTNEDESYNVKKVIRPDKESLETMENIPAYKRKKVNINVNIKESESKNVSKYSLSEDEDNESKVKKNNSFLHNRVD